jgi:protein-arginine kinase activator protein McsA
MLLFCAVCKQKKTKISFHRDAKNKTGVSYACKQCAITRATKWYSINKNKRDKTIAWTKHITKYWPTKTPEEAQSLYQDLLSTQNFSCKICLAPESFIDPRAKQIRRLAVDHCHKTNKVRGLLCNRCNKCIGQFDDSIILLQQAIIYLKENS